MTEKIKFDEYKMIIEDTARFSERRQQISNTYITINSLLLTAIAFMFKDSGAKSIWVVLLPVPLVVAGLFVSFWWSQLILKYKNLVGLRMDILYEMEKTEELAGLEKIYHIEEQKYYPRDEDGNMLEDNVSSFSNLENRLPIMFGLLYIVFGFVLLLTFCVRIVMLF